MVTSNVITIKVSAPVASSASSITLTASSTSVTTGTSVTFTGVVTSNLGTPYSGATVTLTDSNGTTMTTVTSSTGAFTFSITFPTVGSFNIQASA